MRNLLSAGFVRLWKSRMLWASCGAMGAATMSAIWTRYSEGVKYGYHSSLDSVFFYNVLVLALLIPILCALFIGVEYADGTMRNKLICGHQKGSVYLSNLLVCSVASLMIFTFAAAPGLCLGVPLLGGFEMGRLRAVLFFASVYALSLAWTALFTFVAMMIGSRTFSLVAAMLLSLALVMAGVYLEGRLEAPPALQGYELSINGELVLSEPSPNPHYLEEGPVRSAFEFLCDFTPGGQTVRHMTNTAEKMDRFILYDAAIVVTVSAAGVLLFRRKDLK